MTTVLLKGEVEPAVCERATRALLRPQRAPTRPAATAATWEVAADQRSSLRSRTKNATAELRPIGRVAACAALVLLVLASGAAAANPARNGLYSGAVVNPAGTGKKLSLHVAPTGASATAAFFCTGARIGLVRFPILNGRFVAVSRLGSVVQWTLKGRVLSLTRIVATLVARSVCDGKGGPVVLKLSGT